MTISIAPTVVESISVSWVALCTSIGLIVGTMLFLRRRDVLGVNWSGAFDVVLVALLSGLAGARLLHIVDYWDFYAGVPARTFYVWNGGMSLWGAVGGGLIGGLWQAKRLGMDIWHTADVAALSGLVGIAIGRVGDFAAGERAATSSTMPWAVVYSHPEAVAFADGTGVHPVALYEFVLAGSIAAALRLWGGTVPRGWSMLLALGAWGFGRTLIALVRLDPQHIGLQQAQWAGLAAVVFVAVAWWQRWRSI